MNIHHGHINNDQKEYSYKRMILDFIILLMLFLIVLSLIGYS